jgi:hypothetical protein
MLVALSDISPSPYNPKEPFTKKQLAALKRNIERYGFLRDLLVCRDFDTGRGYYCLDGHTAIELLKELGRDAVECKVVDRVKDRKTLTEFVTGYAIHKKPLISEMYKILGDSIEELYGKTAQALRTESAGHAAAIEALRNNAGGAVLAAQTQYFLTLPEDCVERLKAFCKTKAFRSDKTEAIIAKIDAMSEERFLENILQIIL